MKINGKVIKILGITATVIGMGTTLLSDWVADMKLDEKVAEKVAEVLKMKGENK